jgi:hypothetical protein
MTDGKNWLKGVYRFGFQGRAPETRGFLSGMHVDLHTGSGGEVLIVASGRTVGRDALNGSIDAFLSHTGLAPFAVDGKMRADLDAKQSDIAQIYGENPFLERGLYMCAPLIYKGIGVYSVKTEIVPLG